MFVDNVLVDFYDLIKGKHLLVLVNYDVDALCACKIFQTLFRVDSTLYTVVPVEGREDLVGSYADHSEQVKFVLLVNCGATIDVVERLQPAEDVIFFIVDSHRPIDVCNVYSRSQVRIIGKTDDADRIPKFEDIFIDSETEDEGEVEVSEESILKAKRRNEWEEKRNRMMFEYSQFTYYGRASSLVSFEVLWTLGKEDLDCLWWAVIGVTYQLVTGLVVEQKYTCELPVLQLHLSRLCPPSTNVDRCKKADDYIISSQKDLRLVLYRHWSVQDSLKHTMCTAVRMKLWTVGGEKRLFRLLAEIGLPLIESRQNYYSMEHALRNEFLKMFESIPSSYKLDDMFYHSFSISIGYQSYYQASDYVYAMMALLDNADCRKRGDGFLEALDSLGRTKTKILDGGISRAKKKFQAVMRQVQNLLEANQIISAGPFLYFSLGESSPNHRMFSYPGSLALLARYALAAYTSLSQNKKSRMLPLIASSLSHDETCIILGIPSASDLASNNFFTTAFEQAAEVSGIEPILTYFYPPAIKISHKNRPKFFNALASILT